MITKEKINQTGYFLIKKPSSVTSDEADIILKYFRLIHQHPMTLFRHTIDRKLKKLNIEALVSQRLKRVPSIIKKLRIQKNMKLSRVQDIGGLRIVVDTIDQVNSLRDEIKKLESHGNFKFTFANEKNYIKTPQESGYRSIHMVYKYDKNIPSEKQCRVEIQIRTKLQHSWATAVEVTGTYLNQPLKQSFGNILYLDVFKNISKLFIGIETKNYNYNYEFIKKVIQNVEKIKLLEKLKSFNIVSKHCESHSLGKHLLLKMDFKQETIDIFSYSEANFEKANDDYLRIEKSNLKNHAIEIVLVSIQDIKKLSQSYPNYFMDTTEFIKNLQRFREIVKILKSISYLNNDRIKKESKIAFEEIFTKMIRRSKE